MAFDPKDWSTGETITEAEIDRIEQGIADAHAPLVWTRVEPAAYQNGWHNTGANAVVFVNTELRSTRFEPAYTKDQRGMVYLRGAVGGGDITGDMFTLPEGYRPDWTPYVTEAYVSLTVVGGMADDIRGTIPCCVTVSSLGAVRLHTNADWVDLAGISFQART